MLPRLVRTAYVIGVVAALFLALQAFGGYDDVPGAGASFQVRVGEITGSPSPQDVAQALRGVARDTGADVAYYQDDLTDPSHRNYLYVVPGSPGGIAAERLESGFRHFRPSLEEVYRPYDALGDADPRGYYLVWGERADADLMLARLRDLGLDGEVASWPVGPGSAVLSLRFLTPTQLVAVATGFLAVMTMIGGGVVASAQAYGVQRLQGRSFGVALLRDLREVGRLALATLGAAAAVGLAALWFYNRWARLGEIAIFVGVFMASLLLVALLAHVAAMALTFRAPVLAAVKGQFSAGWALGVLFAVRLTVVLLAASVAFSTLQTALQVRERAAAQELWITDPDAVYVALAGQMGGDDPELDARVGEMARTAVVEGAALLVNDVTIDLGTDTVLTPAGGEVTMRDDACPALMVSPQYLSRQTVLDASGRRLTEVDPAALTIVATAECADFARETAPARAAVTDEQAPGEDQRPVEYVTAAPGQSHFTYGTDGNRERSPVLRDAVLIVVPPEGDPTPAHYYLSYLTDGAVVFRDEATARAYVDRFGVGSMVIGIWSAAQDSAELYAEVAGELRTNLLSLGTAVAILLVTAVSVGLVHVRRSAQAVYVRHISGWPWWLSHLPVLAVEAGVLAVVVTTGLEHLTDPGYDLLLQAQVFGGRAAVWQAGTAVAIGALGIVSVVLALHVATARLVATRSADS